MTVHGDPSLVERGLATGALGYVLKVAAGDDLIPAVRAALARRTSRQPSAAFFGANYAYAVSGHLLITDIAYEVYMSVVNISSSRTCRKRTSNTSRSSPSRSRDG